MGSVEHGVRASLHRATVVLTPEIRAVTEVDVAGAAECGEAQSESGSHVDAWVTAGTAGGAKPGADSFVGTRA